MPQDSVGRLAVAAAPTGLAGEPLAEVRRRLSGARHEALDLVLVLDAGGLYAGAADLRDVMAGPADARLATLVRPGWPHVTPETDQEHAAEAAIAAGVAALPVVDAVIANIGAHGKKVDMHLESLWDRNISITTRLVDTATIPMLFRTVSSNKIDPTLLITHHFKLDQILDAYDTFANAAETKALKVIIDA